MANSSQQRIDAGLAALGPYATRGQGTGTMFSPTGMGTGEPTQRLPGTLQDPIAQIIQRIGKLRGTISQNRGRFGSPVNEPMQEELNALEELMKNYGTGKEGSVPQQRPTSKSGGSSGWSGQGGGVRSGPPGMGEVSPPLILDPYRETRNQAKEAAARYLAMRDPHLIKMLMSK